MENKIVENKAADSVAAVKEAAVVGQVQTAAVTAAAQATGTASAAGAADAGNPKKQNIFRRIFCTKKGIIGTAVVAVAGIMCVVAALHFGKNDNYGNALGNVAEARYYMKSAETVDLARVQLYSGTREDPYAVDGVAHTNKAFTVVSVEPINADMARMVELPAEITIDGQTTAISLTKNPYGTNFATDLGKLVDGNSAVSVTLKMDDATPAVFDLKNVMPETAITWEKALEIATAAIDDKIDTKKGLETYVKLLCDKKTVGTPYWYVTFVTEDGGTLFVIIDAAGKVVGKSK